MSWAARLATLVTRRPGAVLLGALACTLAVAPLALRLRLDTDIYDMFPQDRPVAAAFARFSKAFIAEPVIVVLVESSDPGKLSSFVDPFAEKLRASPLVGEVQHRLTGEAARFFRDHLIGLLDEDELDVLRTRTEPDVLRASLQRLRGLLAAPGGSAMQPILTADPFDLLPLVGKRLGGGVSIDASSGLFKSADGRALLLYVRPKHVGSDPEQTRALLAEVGALAAPLGGVVTDGSFSGGAGIELSFTGPSIYALHYRDWLHRDMTRSTVLSALAVLFLFGVLFRALKVLPFVGLPLLIGLVWTGAIAELLFHRINAVSLAFGTILISIGIDLPIQLYNRLREELGNAAPRDALRRTIERFAGPALLATLAPAAVFAACMVSRFRGLRELGALAALGLCVNCVAMLTLFPSLLALLPGRLWGERAVPVAARGPFRALGELARRHPRRILAVAAIVFLAAIPLSLRVRFDRSLFAQPPRMAPSQVQEELERRFGQRDGAAIAYVEEHGSDPAALDELALQASDRWLGEAVRLKAAGLLRGYQSLSLLVPSAATQRARRAKLDAFDPHARAAQIRTGLEALDIDAGAFAGFLAQLDAPLPPVRVQDLPHELDFLVRLHLHHDPGEARVASYLYPVTGPRAAEALAEIARAPERIGGVVTGKPYLEPALREVAERDTLHATLLAAALVFALVFAHQRRWRPSVAILLPLLLAWIGFAACLALFEIPLNLYNLIAVPLVIGYGIDDHVFLLHRYQESGDVGEALASTGKAIVVTSFATTAGFLPIAFARFPALRLLGVSGALAVALCMLAAFAVLPALLVLLVRAPGSESR